MGLTYRDAGVDIDRGHELVRRIGPLAASTRRAGVMGSLGGFAGLFDPRAAGWTDPVLVSGTDGVGTKLDIAFQTGVHDTVGVDLVAMCVNDILCAGAEPLFFLDYLATGRLEPSVGEAIVRGVAEGCRQAGCALLGGETAEMPGLYAEGTYDLAGFAVGAAERSRLLPRPDVQGGDVLVGLPSSGLHSNGFSLARRALLAERGLDLRATPAGLDRPLGETLLTPTRIYVTAALALLRALPDAVRAMAHITGGGLVENVPRVLPDGFSAELDWGSWPEPPVFDLIRAAGVDEPEMRRTFNLGLGLVIVVSPDAADAAVELLVDAGESPVIVGTVGAGGA